ncbi:MAG: hypothetical protein ACYTBJ_17150 [Planctomycetota bacterium]|jgi:hypothetical protein
MRAALQKWIKQTGDLGGLDEDELIERMWPDRKQPVTATPTFQTTAVKPHITALSITCATEGASIGYRVGEAGRWLIYQGPIGVRDSTTVQAKAVRIGCKESQLAQFEGP